MTALKCVVEGCNQEYDVTCSFSFYNVNTTSNSEALRQEWIEGAVQEESECLWRHVSLQLCGYHFELDAQGLWIDSPMLPELLTVHEQPASGSQQVDVIRMDHNYSTGAIKMEADVKSEDGGPSRLNVRHLVDALGYLSLKSLQRKQLWVVKVDSEQGEASVNDTEQVITKMADPNAKQIIEIIPPMQSYETAPDTIPIQSETLEIMEETTIPDNFIYEIAEEQEVSTEEVKDIPYVRPNREWTVNIVPEDTRPKFAYIKHCIAGKKKRHFTSEMNEITIPGHYENLYILPDADPSVGVEITTTYEPENYIVDPYQHLVLQEEHRPKKRSKESNWREMENPKRRKQKKQSVKEQVRKIKTTLGVDWSLDNNLSYPEQDMGSESDERDSDSKRGTSRVRRKNKKYLGYDFVT